MLPVIVDQTREGRICPHLSKTMPLKLNHKTLTWAITTWPMITLRHRDVVIISSVTMPELSRMSLPKLLWPHQRPCVLTSCYRIHISNHSLRHLQRRLTHLSTKFSRLQPAPLQPSSVNCL